MVHVESLLAFEEGVAFFENSHSHLIQVSGLQGITIVSDGVGVVGQVFLYLVELLFGFVGFALQGVDIDEVGVGSVVIGMLFGICFQLLLGFVVVF